MEEAVYAPRVRLIEDAFKPARKLQLFPKEVDIKVVIDAFYGARC